MLRERAYPSSAERGFSWQRCQLGKLNSLRGLSHLPSPEMLSTFPLRACKPEQQKYVPTEVHRECLVLEGVRSPLVLLAEPWLEIHPCVVFPQRGLPWLGSRAQGQWQLSLSMACA